MSMIITFIIKMFKKDYNLNNKVDEVINYDV